MSIGELLLDIFRILEKQTPKSFHQILGLVGGLRIRITVDEDRQTVSFSRTGLALNGDADEATAHIKTSKQCIRNLVDGKRDFVDAIRNDDVYIRCDTSNLTRLEPAFVLLLQSSARSSEIQNLYLNYVCQGMNT